MSERRTRTVSVSVPGGDRGQTTQDFAVGIGIFLIAIAFVFSYVPTLLTPFSADVGTAETAQADRIAATIVEEFSSDGDGPNELDNSTNGTLSKWEADDDLEGELGLRSTDDVNVTVSPLNESATESVIAVGDEYDEGQSAASAGRIVTVEGADECDPACRLVVRVW